MSQPGGSSLPTETPRRAPMLQISPPITDSIAEVEAASAPQTQCPVYHLLETQGANDFIQDPTVGEQSKSDENIPLCTSFQNENSQAGRPVTLQDPTSDVAHS
ncbi:hypothetical protein TWF718_010559 [Orbilia javanica]|uniref:Uncharacterized protein n=1 Tax=Orbilia javanica TaxID=47235 RepID=A0AAN8MJU2_9PEZI